MGTRRRTTTTDAAASCSGTQVPPADAGFPSIRSVEDRLSDANASGVRFGAVSLPETELGARAPIASDQRFARVLPLWSRTQAIVGVLTGVLSIAGALYSGVSYLIAPKQGEVAALVRESRTDRPLTDATIEVLTPENTLVTTLAPAADGWTRHSLYAGKYHIRVTRPGFGSDTKPIQVLPGRSVEVRFQLSPRRGGFFAGDGSGGSPGPVSRFLGRLGL